MFYLNKAKMSKTTNIYTFPRNTHHPLTQNIRNLELKGKLFNAKYIILHDGVSVVSLYIGWYTITHLASNNTQHLLLFQTLLRMSWSGQYQEDWLKNFHGLLQFQQKGLHYLNKK